MFLRVYLNWVGFQRIQNDPKCSGSTVRTKEKIHTRVSIVSAWTRTHMPTSGMTLLFLDSLTSLAFPDCFQFSMRMATWPDGHTWDSNLNRKTLAIQWHPHNWNWLISRSPHNSNQTLKSFLLHNVATKACIIRKLPLCKGFSWKQIGMKRGPLCRDFWFQIPVVSAVGQVLNPSMFFWFMTTTNSNTRQTLITNRKAGTVQNLAIFVCSQKESQPTLALRKKWFLVWKFV